MLGHRFLLGYGELHPLKLPAEEVRIVMLGESVGVLRGEYTAAATAGVLVAAACGDERRYEIGASPAVTKPDS